MQNGRKVQYGVFPYAGGKAMVASTVWDRFGKLGHYVEPFAGSLAVLINCPYTIQTITINDKDCYVANFWRAMTIDPDAVVSYANAMPSEVDIHAWSLFLHNHRPDISALMEGDPIWYDAEFAGKWAYGMTWCFVNNFATLKTPNATRPSFSIPTYGNRKIFVCDEGKYRERFEWLKTKIRGMRVACGDWTRVLKNSIIAPDRSACMTGVFLDPPYDAHGEKFGTHYAENKPVLMEVLDWCRAHANIPNLKIAMCGYDLPEIEGWERVEWQACGGFGNQNKQGNDNKKRETIIFSPSCRSETWI